MGKVKLLRNLLAVQSLGKPDKHKTENSIFVNTEDTHNVGTILLVGADLNLKFSVGQKIYFGNTREKIRMGSQEVMVMEESNVYAIVETEDESFQV